MGIGVSLLLAAAGAILIWAVDASVSGVDLTVVGVILLVVGCVGALLSLILIYVINVQSFGWTIQFHFPARSLIQASAVIMIASFLAGLFPARIAEQTQIADRLAEE